MDIIYLAAYTFLFIFLLFYFYSDTFGFEANLLKIAVGGTYDFLVRVTMSTTGLFGISFGNRLNFKFNDATCQHKTTSLLFLLTNKIVGVE